MAPFISDISIVLVDNASIIHKKYDALNALQQTTRNRYAFIPVYSPPLSPIERGLSNVWNFVQGYEDQRKFYYIISGSAVMVAGDCIAQSLEIRRGIIPHHDSVRTTVMFTWAGIVHL